MVRHLVASVGFPASPPPPPGEPRPGGGGCVRSGGSGRRWRTLPASVLAAVGLLAGVGGLSGQRTPSPAPSDTPPQRQGELVPGDTVWATPDGRYGAGPLWRAVLGSGHRELWSVPVRAPVLDLETFGGGLEPVRLGGGLQTRSLRFRDARGTTWNFRSLDKDAARTLDPVLRETLAADVLQDRVSALYPLSAMVVSPLLEAAGVLHARPRLVVMPDHPRLGEYREEFAGLLGWIEERPDEGDEEGQAGFAGSTRVVSSETLLERLEERPGNRVDAPAFLRARLMDMLVGDWDRHPDQWRWAGFRREGALVFEPVPRDRDWALSRLDGLLSLLTAVPWPHYVGFDAAYPSAFRLSWSGRALDRRLLSELDRTAWDAVVDDLVRRLDDTVIEDAVARLPEGYRERTGGWLAGALKRRRDRLPDLADEWYRLLAGWVDVHATDEDERARLMRRADGTVEVVVEGAGEATPGFRRTFLPGETREVRLYLHGGDDEAVVTSGDGAAGGSRPPSGDAPPVVVRVVGGGGDDTLRDETRGGAVSLHDDGDDDVLAGGPDTRVDRAPWDDPVDADETTHRAGARDWGGRWVPTLALSGGPDQGVFVGAGARHTTYGFRAWPYRRRFEVSAGIATLTGRPAGSVAADLPGPLPDSRLLFEARLTGAEVTRFYGFGNETAAPGDDAAPFRAERWGLGASALLTVAGPGGVRVGGGLAARSVHALEESGTLVAEERPYGWGDFDHAAVLGEVEWDGRGDGGAGPGPVLRVEGLWAPALLDATEDFGVARAGLELSAVPGPRVPLVLARAGAERSWGRVAVHEAPSLGGASTLRGYRNQRWAGDAAVFAGVEARLRLGELVLLLPGDVGVLALADWGRVFLDGESSGAWHGAVGAGLWASFIDELSVSVSVARGEETLIYLGMRREP